MSFLRTPKAQVLVVFAVLLAIAAPGEGGLAMVPHLASGVLAACAVDQLYTYFETRRWIVPTSTLLTGVFVAFILGPQEPPLVVA